MKRRRFLTNLSTGVLGTSLAMSGTAKSDEQKTRPTFVFVHGAWHGGWCWSEVVRLLSEQGYNGVTLDLPGHSLSAQFPTSYGLCPQDTSKLSTEVSPLANTTLHNYRDYVLSAINGLVYNGGGPVILVGHSLAGVTLNAVAEAQPALIRRLVYLTAYVPLANHSVLDYLSQPNFAASEAPPLFLGDPAKLGAIRINPNSNDPTYVSNVRRALYLDVEESVFAATLNLLTPDEPVQGFSTPSTVTVGHWGSVPRSFIRCTDDHIIPIAGQDQMIAEADKFTPRNVFTQKTLSTSHSAFLSRPAEVVTALLEMI